MPATERLYYLDSHLIEFEAHVIDTSERVSGWTAVRLDRTAFYPTGGGQPSDTGTLNGTRVVECIDDEQNGVWHVLQGQAPQTGSIVRGRIDWLRRLDHIQQHTGQHILSQAFVTLFKAPTHSFRVLEQSCEIDVEILTPTTELIERAVELANNVIWEDRAVTIRQVTAEEAAELPLRKDSSREGELRLIEIDGFDLTPCGGTHANRTGEVGMIAVRSWERAKGLTRIEFVAGGRALADYRRANHSARAVAALFSSGREDAPELAEKMVQENKELQRQVRSLEEIAARFEAEELLAVFSVEGTTASLEGTTTSVEGTAASVDGATGSSRELETRNPKLETAPVEGTTGSVEGEGMRIVANVFDNRDAESLRRLAQALIAHPRTIALLGARDKETARLVFARSADATGNMNILMREACATLNGRGGGKPDMAQGGGQQVEKLADAIEAARLAVQAGGVPDAPGKDKVPDESARTGD